MEGETRSPPDDARQRRFTQLTNEFRRTLRAVASRYCAHDPATSEDLVQETYERAWKHLDSLHDERKVLPWLITILRNAWIDACRKRVRVIPVPELPERPVPHEEPSAWQRITIDDFHRAIERLKEPYRSVAIMHDIDQLSNDEIAQRLGITYATAATRLHRAHKQLKQLLRVTEE